MQQITETVSGHIRKTMTKSSMFSSPFLDARTREYCDVRQWVQASPCAYNNADANFAMMLATFCENEHRPT